MASVTVKSLQDMQQLVVTSGHELLVDYPQDGGDGIGPTSYELLLASLAT